MDDLLLNEDQTLKVVNGDLAIGDCDDQNVYDIMISHKGEYKCTPQIGVDSLNLSLSNFDINKTKNIVRLNLEIDKFIVDDVIIDITDTSIDILPICKR